MRIPQIVLTALVATTLTARSQDLISGQSILQKGLHPFRLDFIEGDGGFTLKLRYSTPGAEPKEIPASWFSHLVSKK
jgi:hypothetical protein